MLLESFFIFGDIPSNAETGKYIPTLVILSYIIASLGSFTGLRLALEIHVEESASYKRILHWAGAFAFGSAIWSMHFIGMLAYKMDMQHDYDPVLTLISMVIAIVIAYGVLQIIRTTELKIRNIIIGAFLLGFAICGMHYTGMTAMQMDADLRYIPSIFALSVLIAVAASAAALLIVFILSSYNLRRKIIWQAIAAMIMGFAICGMHYTGMWASVFIPYADCRYEQNQNYLELAFIIALTSSVIIGLALSLCIYKRTKYREEKLGFSCFPYKLLIVSILISFFSILWSMGDKYSSYKTLTKGLDTSITNSLITSEIIELDTLLTQSASMAVNTEDMKWEDKYNNYASQLDSKILEIRARNDNIDMQHINATSEANNKLVDLEAQIFIHVRNRDTAKANKILTSDIYIENKEIYSKGVHDFSDQIQSSLHENLSLMTARHHYSLYPTTISLILMAISWVFSIRSIKRWQKEVETSREDMNNRYKDTQNDKKEVESLHNSLKVLINAVPDGIYRLDMDKRITMANQATETITGYKINEAIGEVQHELIHHSHSNGSKYDSEECPVHKSLITGKRKYIDNEVFWHKNGSSFPVSYHSVPIIDKSNEITGCLISFRNISEDKERELELHAAVSNAEKANSTKSAFLANMSHELRTPLNSIMGMVQLMDMQELDIDVIESFSLINISANNLLKIVNDILDLSKIEANEIELEYQAFNLIECLNHSINSLKNSASQKGLLLSYAHKLPPVYALGDELRVSRILTNLISNAINYTEKGEINVDISADKTSKNTIKFICTIKDTGIGIPPDRIDKIFDKFTQADSSITRKFGGTGLGLAITRELVEIMDGKIGVESVHGVGSSFWIEIPFEVLDELPKEKKAVSIMDCDDNNDLINISDARILVVEDHIMNQLFIKKFFKILGVGSYHIAENGALAVEEAKLGDYDLILMDCHMPEMNGYDATKAIRQLDDPKKRNIPIIAMTANAMVEDETRCINIGMDAYIAKPVDIGVFKNKLSKWIDFEKITPPTSPDNDDSSSDIPVKNNDTPPVDLKNLRENSMDDEDFVKEMIKMFVAQGEEQLALLKEQCSDGLNDEWVEISHSLKGTSGGVGAMKMRDICADAQNMADSSSKSREDRAQKIEDEYNKAKEYFINEGLYVVKN